jgi:hypothetical protein
VRMANSPPGTAPLFYPSNAAVTAHSPPRLYNFTTVFNIIF